MNRALDAALLAAHDQQDAATLAVLYAQAADRLEGAEAAFFLTQAYVWALEAGTPDAAALNRRLAARGRDDLQNDL